MSAGPPLSPGAFAFGVGIEDTCVYPADGGRPPLDEHELTGHGTHWADDLRLAADLGATVLRYGAGWPLAHVAPGRFDWSRLDPAVALAGELGLSLVVDLVHYGTPTWLAEAFADPGFPDAIEEFGAELARRYRGSVHAVTPLNEPLTTASFCGLRGVWPPYRTDWEGWVAVAVPIALGIARTTAAVRAAAGDVAVVHVEAATLVSAADEDGHDDGTAGHARLLRQLGWLPTDLALGRVTPEHPMHGWLLRHGARPDDLAWLVAHAAEPDVLGVNYYPNLTPRRVVAGPAGPVQVAHDRWTAGLAEALRGFADRYRLPVAVTETSVEGDDELRSRWLVDSLRACGELRRGGLDLRGYVWWPLLDFVDWSWAAGGANVEEFAVAHLGADGTVHVGPAAPLGRPDEGKSPFLRRMGLVRLEELADGSLRRVPTATAQAYRAVAGPR